MTRWCVEASRLVKHFGSVRAVDGLDLQVASGEVFGLLGPNGAGKTTSLEMLEGLIEPDSGDIRILGMRWADDGQKIRERIGVQFQATQLDEKIKVREALELFGAYYSNAVKVPELLSLLQLEDKADAFQGQLSGGQRQRLALGLSLVNSPDLLFLDEPTTGLDPQARRNLWQLLRDIKKQGRTVLVTTHYMDEAEALCDRVGIIDRGRLLELGTPRDLIASLKQPSTAELRFLGADPDVNTLAARLGLPVEVEDGQWSIALSDPVADLQHVLACVENAQLTISQLHVHRPTLEDVFLSLTGRRLRD